MPHSGRLGDRAPVELGDLNEYVPPARVAATTVFRAIYYATDRRAFFRHVAAFTEKKLVFDLNPRQYRLDDVLGDLRAAGLPEVALRPFFMPQTVALPRPAAAVARSLESSGPARAPGAPLPLHLPRRRSSGLASEERLEAGGEHRAQLAPVRVVRVDVMGRERRRDLDLHAPRTVAAQRA